MSRLLLISRADILEATSGPDSQRLFRILARLNRGGYQLLATAPQPDHWTREQGGKADALLGPDSIRKQLADAGGFLEGVYFVPRSLLTQRRNRETALQDMMGRYAIQPENCYLFSSSEKFAAVARDLGIHATTLNDQRKLMNELKKLLKNS